MKKGFILVGIIVVAVVITSFSFFWPLNDSSDLKGTIGGVEKADKFRGEQMEAADLLLENEEFIAFTQSAEWQNTIKNEELVNFLKSDEFKSFISMTGDIQKVVMLNRYFDSVKLGLLKETDPNEATLKVILKSNYSKVFSALSSDPNNHDFQQVFLLISQEFQKAMANPASIEALNFADVMKYVVANTPSTDSYFSQDMQKLVNSQDFHKLVNSNDFQNAGFPNQDFQNVMVPLSLDFQKQFMSQDFQKQFMSQDFQSLILKSNFFGLFWTNNQNFQQNMLGAFQDYMQLI